MLHQPPNHAWWVSLCPYLGASCQLGQAGRPQVPTARTAVDLYMFQLAHENRTDAAFARGRTAFATTLPPRIKDLLDAADMSMLRPRRDLRTAPAL
jgi:hypothetical protein